MATSTKVTERQQKVLDGLKANKSPRDIASEMKISVNGVYGHIRRMRKAGLIPHEPKRMIVRESKKSARSRRSSAKRGRNGRPANDSAIVRAIREANSAADARLVEIANEEDRLRRERETIEAARAGR